MGAEDKMAPPSISEARSTVEPGPVVPGFQKAVDIVNLMSLIYTLEDERCVACYKQASHNDARFKVRTHCPWDDNRMIDCVEITD